MNWVKDFYRKQFIWTKEWLTDDVDVLADGSLAKLRQFSDQQARSVLELGAGNGHFAIKAARNGYFVTVIEIVPECIDYILEMKGKYHIGNNLQVIQGDFYTVKLDGPFDVVCYWDGFGTGGDSDQAKLMQRVSGWLKQDGVALIDVYTPWFWANVVGEGMHFGNIYSQYDFDADGCRMLNTWWLEGEGENAMTQSLRCYSPSDLRLLLKAIPLQLAHCEPDGAMDYANWKFHEDVPLNEAMTFMAVIKWT